MPTRYKTTADLPDTVPLFPLAGVILLPRATLPLNIFEPRYLALFDDVMRGDRLVGIIQPAIDGGPTGSPQMQGAPLLDIGCAGRVTTYQETADGRLTIVLTGVSRFHRGAEIETGLAYRTFRVDFSVFKDDLTVDHGEDDVDRDRLLNTLKRYLAQRNLRADWNAITQTSAETLVNWLSVASPFGGPEKQALLEARTLAERATALVTLAEMELATGGESSGDGGGRLQ